jgi:arachidonate 5-lipoxygenase
LLQLIAAVAKMAFGFVALARGLRATHSTGVGAEGEFLVDATLPAHAFFRAGARMRATLRHATLQSSDDAALDIRGATIRLLDDRGEILDLPMNTGPVNTFQNAWVLLDFMRVAPLGALGYRLFDRKHPRIWAETLKAYRRAPSSYTSLRYYGQLLYRFAAIDERPRYIRYRLVPGEDVEESGVPPAADLAHPFRQKRAHDEDRPRDYLRTELKERLSGGAVEYRLQAQLHEIHDDDDDVVRDTSREWDEATHPWHDLGRLKLERALDDREAEALCFNIAHQPESLGVLPATSASDFNSIGYLRTVVYAAAARARRRGRAPTQPRALVEGGRT